MTRKGRNKSDIRIRIDHESTTGSFKQPIMLHMRREFGLFVDKVLSTYTPKMLGLSMGFPLLYLLWAYLGKPILSEEDVFTTQSDFVVRYLAAIGTFGNPYTTIELTPEEYAARGIALYLAIHNLLKSQYMGKQLARVATRAEELSPIAYDYLVGRITNTELEKILGDISEPNVAPPIQLNPITTPGSALPNPLGKLDLPITRPDYIVLIWNTNIRTPLTTNERNNDN